MIDLLPIFPCNLAKEPLTARGFKDAKRGARGWKGWPLVGFPTGAKSGFDILDIDPSGRDWFGANFDALPTTRAHETQRGLHLLFKHAKGLGCSSGKIAEGIDVRADGGYAIWWPSTGRPIEDAPICEWPDWLLAEAMGKGTGKEEWYPSKRGIIPTPHDPLLATDCTAALRRMNVEDWRGEHDPWFELLMGCKYVGISLSDFVEWCVTDPRYANDAEIIGRKWHSVEPKHGGAFWRECAKRKIKVEGRGDNLFAKVPNYKPEPRSSSFQPSRSPDARLNYIAKKIAANPTERALFSWACLAAEIVHECKRKPSSIAQMLEGAVMGTALWETLGREGVRRTIVNAFRHVEEKYLAEPNEGQKGELTWQ
jgi:hypothetical protein